MTSEPARRGYDEVLRRVRGEFLEMPGLWLSELEARRLWGLDAEQCTALLGALVEAKFLFKTCDGAFMRAEHAALASAALYPRSNSRRLMRRPRLLFEGSPPAGWPVSLAYSR